MGNHVRDPRLEHFAQVLSKLVCLLLERHMAGQTCAVFMTAPSQHTGETYSVLQVKSILGQTGQVRHGYICRLEDSFQLDRSPKLRVKRRHHPADGGVKAHDHVWRQRFLCRWVGGTTLLHERDVAAISSATQMGQGLTLR